MRRTNRFAAHPRESWQKAYVCEWLAASCAFYNEVNYRRRQAHLDDRRWREAQTSSLYDEYSPVLGAATAQTLVRKNSEAWESFETLDADSSVKASPPGYWGNRDDGYPLRSIVRNDCYDITWGRARSTIEIPVGKALNEKFDVPGSGYRVTLELRGKPRWAGKQGRLEISYDELDDCFRVHQPVAVQPDLTQSLRPTKSTPKLPTENTATIDGHVAAIDVGANNTPTILTEKGDIAVFQARAEFETFASGLEHISELQTQLPPWIYSSTRIRRAYRKVSARRNHHRDASVKRAAQWLAERGVKQVLVGDLAGVLETHWSAVVNQKTHNFWSHGQLTARLADTFAVYGIDLEKVSEAGSSSTCPYCDTTIVVRHGDALVCPAWGVKTHADIAGAALILSKNTKIEVSDWFDPDHQFWPMARPAPPSSERGGDGHRIRVTYLQWDDHEWTPISSVETGTLGSLDQRGVSQPVSSAGAMAGCIAYGGISSQSGGEDVTSRASRG